MSTKTDGGIRRGFIVLWTLVGLGLLALATALVGGWKDATFWSSVLVNLGTTIFLAGFLVWLERRLVATTRTVAKEAAIEAASEVATVAEEATRTLSERIDAIQERFEQQLAEQAAQEDLAVSALATDISFDSVMTAMSTALEMGAVNYQVHVSAGDLSSSLVLGVHLATDQDQQRFDDYSKPVIVGLKLSVDTDSLGTAYVVEVDWNEGDDPIEVFTRLRSEMVRAGYGPESRGLNFDRMFQNLKLGLKEAVAGRRGDKGTWRSSGTLTDIISDDWVVSELGLEERAHGIVADDSILGRQASPINPFVPPPAPDWADEATWKAAIGRARKRLRYRSFF